MIWIALADFVVLLHLAFVAFVVAGGLFVLWRRRAAWLHLPAAAWGAWTEFAGWVCPLTPLENWLRVRGGGAAYTGDFVERYLLPLLYPATLTRTIQVILGIAVVVVNAAIYVYAFRGTRRSP
jgi:hypothetical protein